MNLIYRITNLINKKYYIGKTNNFYFRIKLHESCARRGLDTKFCRAIRKYGINNFKKEITYNNISDNMINVAEMCAIYVNDSYDSGYNSTFGGEDNPMNHEENRKKISKHHTGRKRPEHSKRMKGKNNPMYGKVGRISGENNPMKKPGARKKALITRETHKEQISKMMSMIASKRKRNVLGKFINESN